MQVKGKVEEERATEKLEQTTGANISFKSIPAEFRKNISEFNKKLLEREKQILLMGFKKK